jgi:hypothetical protein
MLRVQFIREYTSKVDDLVKDKIESQKEERAKEKEEKDLVAQQVSSHMFCLCNQSSHAEGIDIKLHSLVLCRTCMRNCFLLLCPLRQCLAWVVLHLRWVGWACLCLQWVCRRWALVQCQHSGCHRWEATELFLQRA